MTDLVPLRTGFDLALLGYHRDQVRHYVWHAEFELKILTADRDAVLSHADGLTRRLEAARTENRRLRTRIDRICRSPIELDGAGHRVRRMVELAHEEATAITERARAHSEQSWAAVRDVEDRMCRRYNWLIDELEAQAREAAVRRRQVQADFELAMGHRRTEALRRIADREARAEQLVRGATEHRDRVVAGLRAAHEVLTRAESEVTR